MNWDLEIDALGLLCPLPVLRLRKRLKNLKSGTVIKLLADDPAATIDIPHFCAQNGHKFLHSNQIESNSPSINMRAYFIRKS
jgi:tRNA 2-thiouridine synthesizing protein A